MISADFSSRQLIGRTREFAFLLDRARSARGGCVVLRGEAGLGKTRLLRECAAAGAEYGVRSGYGTAYEYASTPYGPLRDALKALGSALPLPREPDEHGRAAWYGEVAAALQATAGGRPAVIVLDDLQWADPAALDLIRACVPALAGAPPLLVLAYRPEDVESDPSRSRALAALERSAEVVALQPLAPGQIEHLLGGILARIDARVPPEIVADVRTLAEGRPLYAEELLRGVLERIERGGPAELAVPTSIRATVRERLAPLDEAARSVLVHGAVFGRAFSADALAALLDMDVRCVFDALRRARDLQLVVEDRESEDDRFAFRHALIREAIYAELLRGEARLVHGRVAELLAASPHPNAAEVAEHAWRARDLAKAAHWNERAGNEERAVYAYRAAARSYERAFQSSSDPGCRARVAQAAAEVHYALGDAEPALEWYARAGAEHLSAGAIARAGRLRLRRARILSEIGRYDEGLKEADAVAADPAAGAVLRVEAETIAAGLLGWSAGRPAQAVERLNRIDQAAASGDPAVAMRVAALYALTSLALGKPHDARAHFGEAVRIAEGEQDLDMLVRTRINWGVFELAYGPLERAAELATQALRDARQAKNRPLSRWVAGNAALVALVAGRLADAGSYLERAAAEELRAVLPRIDYLTLAIRLRLATLLGVEDRELAEAAAAALEARAATARLRLGEALLAAALAQHDAASGATDRAARIVERVGDLAEAEAPYWLFEAIARFGSPTVRDRARVRLAEIAQREGTLAARGYLALVDAREHLRRRDRAAATERADAAAAAFIQAGWRIDAAFALALAGRTAEALALFRQIGALGEVRRLTEVAPAQRRRGEATLTPREREIGRLAADGQSARAIADLLVISERTVETHLASIYRKLGVTNRRELAALLAAAGAP